MDKTKMANIINGASTIGNIIPVIVQGDSMLPTLKDGDLVRVEITNNMNVGDLIVYVYKDVKLIHRVICIKNGDIYCKGDNARGIEKICKDDIIGKAIAKVPP